MRHGLASLVLLAALGGCSLIYNENQIEKPDPDAGPDAEIDAEIIVDADPSMMMITGVTPTIITEGQGAGGSRQAVIVIDGQHMVKSAGLMVMVTATAGTPMLMVDMAAVDVEANGRRLAVPITLPVDPGLSSGTISLDITVMQTVPGGPTITRMLPAALTLKNLPELTAANFPAAGFPALSEYSSVTLTTDAIRGTAGLTAPVVIRATASISLTGTVTANVSAAGTTGGPGGGNGGMGGAGGIAGGNAGAPGTGPAPGAPSGGVGRYEGDEQLTSLKYEDKNRGSGGAGGDGSGILGGAMGGNGGGGGGTIEITAGGDAMLPNITATGAAGTSGAVVGGGGSGGVVLIRAGGNLTAGTINITGGGQSGRGRYDGKMTTVSNGASLFRGPMFVTAPLIANEQKPMITVVGQPSKNFHYFFSSASGADESSLFNDSFPGSGTKTFALAAALYPGLNTLCLVVDGGDKTSETRNCIEIAHLYKP